MGKISQWLLMTSLSLVIAFTVGCVFDLYEKMEVDVPPGDILQVQFQVAADEVLRGSWTADEDIEGSYIRPDGRRSVWSSTSMQHDFCIEGEMYPGLYVFKFSNSGDEAGIVKFRYRIQEQSEVRQR